MPNLPFFTLAPTISPAQSTPGSAQPSLNNTGLQSNGSLTAGGSEENSEPSSLSFYQALNDQLEEAILPVGQDVAAYIQGESGSLSAGLSQTIEPQLVDDQVSAVDQDAVHPSNNLSPWMAQAPIDVEDIQQQRAAQLQVQGTSELNKQNSQQIKWQGGQLNRAGALMDSENALDNKAGAVIQSQSISSSAALQNQPNITNALAGPLGPESAGALIQQNNKILSTSENLAIDDASLLDGELELVNIHEKPITLTSKNVQVNMLTQITPAQLTQTTPAQPAITEIPEAMLQSSQVSSQRDPVSGQLDTAKTLATDPAFAHAPQEKLKLDMPPNAIQWNEQISKRISIMNSEGLQSARIQLDPPELGALEIKIKMTSDQMNVGFTSNQPMVREALEAQAPRLREMMEQEGINLADVNVSDQGQQQAGGQSGDEQMLDDGTNSTLESETENPQVTVSQSDSLVDYFA